jgi:hypothetical protein
MKKGFWFLVLLACLIEPRLVVASDSSVLVAPTVPAPTLLDVVSLIDGSLIFYLITSGVCLRYVP